MSSDVVQASLELLDAPTLAKLRSLKRANVPNETMRDVVYEHLRAQSRFDGKVIWVGASVYGAVSVLTGAQVPRQLLRNLQASEIKESTSHIHAIHELLVARQIPQPQLHISMHKEQAALQFEPSLPADPTLTRPQTSVLDDPSPDRGISAIWRCIVH